MQPDFVVNIWNFCTMTTSDLFTHVFRIYGESVSRLWVTLTRAKAL